MSDMTTAQHPAFEASPEALAAVQAVCDAWHKPMIGDARHRDDIAWYDATLPRRWHRCRAWSSHAGISRCACGATNYGSGWFGKNERRKVGGRNA
ncbi:hypothetical protein [Acrocarpospora sp. B8E8]|uniref:hypothetical protein n=1 Tax=Acrocarpospora sp. B8E8 TaxID=3153572 RepID=UPI00325E74CE